MDIFNERNVNIHGQIGSNLLDIGISYQKYSSLSAKTNLIDVGNAQNITQSYINGQAGSIFVDIGIPFHKYTSSQD